MDQSVAEIAPLRGSKRTSDDEKLNEDTEMEFSDHLDEQEISAIGKEVIQASVFLSVIAVAIIGMIYFLCVTYYKVSIPQQAANPNISSPGLSDSTFLHLDRQVQSNIYDDDRNRRPFSSSSCACPCGRRFDPLSDASEPSSASTVDNLPLFFEHLAKQHEIQKSRCSLPQPHKSLIQSEPYAEA
ncbi:unnamed protein product [Cyprideis torosa]|uniref:Uncharacterized protein n=1 Tax=Cyprideis torosa TaxID=163714 RepID=A0A7R8WGZ4_9CRUS|nr:unnamed protein product [Cyprideis torosa]CAG0892290.1 unnamed protein product [Cyprideis torosa]